MMVILIIVMKELLVWHGGRDTQAIDMIPVFVTSRQAVGRSAEVSIASNKASTWNHTEQALDANWSMLKTVKEKTVTICPDRSSPYCCFFPTYCIYLMLGIPRK